MPSVGRNLRGLPLAAAVAVATVASGAAAAGGAIIVLGELSWGDAPGPLAEIGSDEIPTAGVFARGNTGDEAGRLMRTGMRNDVAPSPG